MKKEFVTIQGKEYPFVRDVALIGEWNDTKNIPVEELKKYPQYEQLDGLILKGYEMKWGVTNENYEQYEQTAFDAFINDYFVAKGLNMPVDINHEGYYNYHAICGRVLYIERNTVGFYFVIYVPRQYEQFEDLLWRLQNGIIQGFSKEGYATQWRWHRDESGEIDYEIIEEMKLLSVSLVSTPANGLPFERMQRVKNQLQYVIKDIEEDTNNIKASAANTMDDLFNN